MTEATQPAYSSEADKYVSMLERDGFAILPQVFDGETVNTALEKLRRMSDDYEKANPLNLPSLALDSPILWNLHMKDAFFMHLLFASDFLQDILRQLLNDEWYKGLPENSPNFILRAMVARSSQDKLKMHIDSMVPYQGKYLFALQCMIILEDMHEGNGATLVVPGSHQSGAYADQSSLEDTVTVTAKAGDVLLLDSRCWHGAGENRSGGSRWTINASFARYWLKQAFNYVDNMPEEIFNDLTDEEKVVAGFCSIPFRDEVEGIDYRMNFDALKDGRRPRTDSRGNDK